MLQELRIKSLTEENLALRKALVEREEAISKLHISVQESSRRIIDYKVCTSKIDTVL